MKKCISLFLSMMLMLSMFSAVFAAPEYSDVAEDSWYAEAAMYCRENGFMNGTSDTEFSPDEPMTRSMLMTALYRRAGSPEVNNENPFSDVASGAWYYNAVLWAEQQGVAHGYGDGLFGTDDFVTREQIVTILWRMAGSPEPEQTAEFTDSIDISSYAAAAVSWAKEKGIINGKQDNMFEPKSNATRAEAAVILMNDGKTGTTPAPAPEPEIEDEFVLVNGGTFTMGSSANEPEREADEVQHSVTVSDFCISKTEVSQAEYQAVMNDNPSENKGDNLPVTNITWYDAIRYCNALSEKAGLTPCYTINGTTVTWDRSSNGYRLPTEAEWEYAARANTTTPFSFGDYVNDSDANCYNAYGYNNDASGSWVNGYLQHTMSVTEYDANAYGLYNMHGNAAEWVWDWYGEYSTNAETNPTGSASGNYKVVRGGGWNDFPKHIRSAYRSAFPANVPLYSIGMRLVRNGVTGQGALTSTSNANTNTSTHRTLLVYFSQTNNTKGLAEIIAEMRDIDVFRIERETPYTGTGNGTVLYGEALAEQRENAVPDLKAYLEDENLSIDDYDTILLGYCNWWASIPAPVRSFLNRYDLSDKTIIPFCSMGGGHFGQTISAVAKLAPNSTIKKGLEVTYSSYNRDEIENWLTESGIQNNDLSGNTDEDNKEDITSEKNAIVVYFSASADNTKRLAETMAAASDSDIARIVPEAAYTSEDLNYNNASSRANTEINTDARPAILPMSENFAQYDTIMLGYPIWHGQTPPAVRTFLDTYKDSLSGKTIIPFCTSGSTGISGSVPKIRELCPNSTVANGFRGTAGMSEEDIMQQLKQNGFNK